MGVICFFKDNPVQCGFEGFVVMKNEPKLKKLSFDEGRVDSGNNYKSSIKNMIVKAIVEKYLAETAEYISGEYIADNQNKFYVIPMTEVYSPFSYLDDTVTVAFKYEDMRDIQSRKLQNKNMILMSNNLQSL